MGCAEFVPALGADSATAVLEAAHSKNGMKKFTILTVAIAFMAGLTLNAADDAKPRGDKAKGEARRAELMKKFDKNSDGKLDDDEKAAMREELKKQRGNRGKKGDAGEKKDAK